ncbi:MAG TPA: hypothetical protein VLA15_10160, partial [Desulfurivibrionaceae bacterium]|nr:hypothetical protein [Desulfurivibrionaceae bacterium]
GSRQAGWIYAVAARRHPPGSVAVMMASPKITKKALSRHSGAGRNPKFKKLPEYWLPPFHQIIRRFQYGGAWESYQAGGSLV